MSDSPTSRSTSGSADDPARPEALRARGCSQPGRWTRANRSPPTPQVSGATTPWVAVAAMAASTALPPALRVSSAASVEWQCGVATACVRVT
jgi:hypothetical protein